MSADEIFDRVLALMFSDESEKNDLLRQFLATLNLLLLELFQKENAMRKTPLTVPPVIENLDDVVDYNERILAFLPYGIAGTMLAEDDPNIATQYKNKYEEERMLCVVARFVDVVNAYEV